jgi:DNA-binding response OmpR family regulator
VRILIIDASPELRGLCETHIASQWPGAAVDARALELPQRTRAGDGGTDWMRYDAVLLDHRANGQTGIEWLRACKDRAQSLPPTILLSDETGEDIAVQAMKLGAADYLRKDKLTPTRLVGAINDAILERARNHDRVLARARLADRFGDTMTQQIDLEAIGIEAAGDAPKINGYRLLRKIGAGGTSKVFLAERLARLGQAPPEPKQVVLKVLDANHMNDSFIERFIREYRIISTVQNEHVSRIFDQGITDDHLYIAMEYFPGGDLRARLGSRAEQADGPRLTSMQTLKVVMQVARALDAIHTAGVIHRDLKPHNIMFRNGEQLALVDFGLAKQVGEKTITATGGGLLATPLYMSPEQCLGKPQDARSDLYSLGVMLYEMFTGRRLFESDNLAAIAFSHVHGEVPPLPPHLSGYQTLLDRLLAKNPDDRFQSARELFSYIAY